MHDCHTVICDGSSAPGNCAQFDCCILYISPHEKWDPLWRMSVGRHAPRWPCTSASFALFFFFFGFVWTTATYLGRLFLSCLDSLLSARGLHSVARAWTMMTVGMSS